MASSGNEKGGALIVTLLLVVSMTLLAGVVLSVSVTETRITANEMNASRAFNVAEAGIEHARKQLETTDVDPLLLAGGVLFNGQVLGGGSYTVVVSNNIAPDYPRGALAADGGGATSDTDGFLVVTSSGTHSGAQRTVEVVVEKTDASFSFDYALYGIDDLQIIGLGLITGDVGTNGSITLGSKKDPVQPIAGDATAGGIVDDHSNVLGTVTEGAAPLTFPPVDCPAPPFGPFPVSTGPDTILHPDGSIVIPGDVDTVFASGDYYFSAFSKTGSGSLIINAGDTVNFYISGAMTIAGGGFVNMNSDASMLGLWGCGATTDEWKMCGGADSVLTVYAPFDDLKLCGGSAKTGSFIAKTVFKEGNGTVTYDSSLVGAGGGGPVTFVPGTWTERPF